MTKDTYPCRCKRRLFTMAGGIMIVAALVCVPAHGQTITWKPGAQQLEFSSATSPTLPAMASSASRAVAVWGSKRIYLTMTEATGGRWSKPQELDDGKGSSRVPQVAMVGDRILVVWIQTVDGAQHVMAKVSANGGAAWVPALPVGVVTGRVDNLCLAMVGTAAVAGWIQEDGGGRRIVTARSVDAGATWEPVQTLSACAARDLTLVASGPRALALWSQEDEVGGSLLSSCSADGGARWGVPRFVETDAGRVYGGAWPYLPQVALEGSRAVAIWCQESNGMSRVRVGSSLDGGTTWAVGQVPRPSASASAYPHIALSDKVALAVWIQDSAVVSSRSTGTGWETPRVVSRGKRTADNPALVLQGGQAVLVWRQYVGAGNSVFASRSLDGGSTWQPPQLLETQDTMAWYPNVAIAGDRAAALWMQYVPDTFGMFGSACAIGDGIWQGPRVAASGSGDAWDPGLAADGNRMLALWPCYEGERWTVRAIGSGNGGDSWSVPACLASGTGQVGAVSVALDGRQVVAVWRQNDGASGWSLSSASSGDGGVTWDAPVCLPMTDQNNDLLSSKSIPATPAVAVDAMTAVAVWRQGDGDTGGLVIARSANGGKTWLSAVPLATEGEGMEPHVAISGKRVLVAWTRRENEGASIRALASADGGEKWGPVICLQKVAGEAGSARIALSGPRSIVVWQQRDGTVNRIYANGSDDEARTWSGAVPVETGFGNAWGPSATLVDGGVLVTWRQREEKQELLCGATSTDSGRTWSAAQRIEDGLGDVRLAPVGAVPYTQTMAFQRTANIAPSVMALKGARAFAARISREDNAWSMVFNSGSVALKKEVTP